jgi:hypothetical protein
MNLTEFSVFVYTEVTLIVHILNVYILDLLGAGSKMADHSGRAV